MTAENLLDFVLNEKQSIFNEIKEKISPEINIINSIKESFDEVNNSILLFNLLKFNAKINNKDLNIARKFAEKYITNIDNSQIVQIQNALMSNYNTLSPLLLLVPVLVIALVILKVPAIPGLIIGVLLGAFVAILFQGASLADVFIVAKDGYVSSTGMEFVDALLTRGGLDSMLSTVSLMICALTTGGILEKTGMLEALAKFILKFAKGTFGLIFATIFTAIGTNLAVADQYLAIVLPGSMYKDAFKKQGLDAKNLSRALEDSATITSPLIPWNTCGAYMSATLGVGCFTFLPFAFFNLLCPIISLIYGATGMTIEKIKDTQDSKIIA